MVVPLTNTENLTVGIRKCIHLNQFCLKLPFSLEIQIHVIISFSMSSLYANPTLKVFFPRAYSLISSQNCIQDLFAPHKCIRGSQHRLPNLLDKPFAKSL